MKAAIDALTEEEPPFRLDNGTLLRGYLARLQSNVRHLASLHIEAAAHPDNTPGKAKARAEISCIQEMRVRWQKLSDDLVIVIGPEAELRNFGELASPGSFCNEQRGMARDPFRITMKALKLLADKARRTHPEVTLLQSWDLKAKERPKE